MHPPDPEMRGPTTWQGGRADSASSNTADNATEPAALQERRVARLYAVSFATAATIARLAYAVAS